MKKNLAQRRAALFKLARWWAGGASVSTLGLTAALAQSSAANEPLKVAWVYVTPITPAGWVHQHELGRQAVQAAFGDRVKTTYVENVSEGADAERVIRDLAQRGNKLIFTPSFGYMEPTLAVARDFPDVRFESITGYKTAPNVAVANARYYEGRYLSGIAAGRMTKTGVAGYVAGFPIPEVLRGINAIPLIGGLNRILGFAFGFVSGLLNCWIWSILLWVAANLTGGKLEFLTTATLNRSVIYGLLANLNPFLTRY